MMIVQNSLVVDFSKVKEVKVFYDNTRAIVKNVLFCITLDDPEYKSESMDFLTALANFAKKRNHINHSLYLLIFDDGAQMAIGVSENILHIGTGIQER